MMKPSNDAFQVLCDAELVFSALNCQISPCKVTFGENIDVLLMSLYLFHEQFTESMFSDFFLEVHVIGENLFTILDIVSNSVHISIQVKCLAMSKHHLIGIDFKRSSLPW